MHGAPWGTMNGWLRFEVEERARRYGQVHRPERDPYPPSTSPNPNHGRSPHWPATTSPRAPDNTTSTGGHSGHRRERGIRPSAVNPSTAGTRSASVTRLLTTSPSHRRPPHARPRIRPRGHQTPPTARSSTNADI